MTQRTITATEIARSLGGKKSGKGWIVKCPAHKDKNPSCSVTEAPGGAILVHCFVGCQQGAVIQALKELNLWPEKEKLKPVERRKVQEFFYEDPSGGKRLRVDRMESAFDKTFAFYHWNGQGYQIGKGTTPIAPYKFSSWKDRQGVIIVEGEKCVHAIEKIGGEYATCIPGGSQAWSEDFVKFFKNKQVVIIPDQDGPGEQFANTVANALLGKSESVKILKLPDLKPKEDVVDWIGRGNTIAELRTLIGQAPKLSTRVTKWQNVGKDAAIERLERLKQSENRINFGNKYLDDVFRGIWQKDLILIGAKTGVGKTEFVSSLAANATQQLKRVYQFALEAERFEITRRQKYKLLSKEWYQTDRFAGVKNFRHLDYVSWCAGDFEDLLAPLEDEINQRMEFEFEYWNVRYKGKDDFNVDTLVEEIEDIKDSADLIIIDHFHFLDFDGTNENAAMTKAASLLNKTALELGKPICLVAHLRKSDRKFSGLMPTIEDFHGTSNLAKICTSAILLSPAPKVDGMDNCLWPTFIQAPKFRKDNSRSRIVARINYDTRINAYQQVYELGVIKNDEFEPIDDQNRLPKWVRS